MAAHRAGRFLLAGIILFTAPALLLPAGQVQDAGLPTLDRIFADGEFQPESYGTVRWLSRLGGYATTAPSIQLKGETDIVRIDPATGKQEVLVSAAHVVPAGGSKPLEIEDFHFSADEARVLIFTNSQRVWRHKTRGDYWILDINSHDLHKLGGDAPPASLMFAAFSPDSSKVAYVRDRQLYVEDAAAAKIRRLTKNASPNVINGTFDWVYEEEFYLFSGFRWSPDSKQIAFWQLDTTGVDDYYLINDVAGLYQQLKQFKYPKAGRPNSSCRIGVVRLDTSGPADFLLDLPGDPRNNYVPWMEWADDSQELFVQQLNRSQNENKLLAVKTNFAKPATIHVERDKTWVDVNTSVTWLDGGKKFTWISERDGWKHAYAHSRTGGEGKLITSGAFDVIDLVTVDEKGGWLYYTASPDNPTQKYLFRARLDGSANERLTPEGAAGTHDYSFSPDCHWAFHTHSTFDSPPTTELLEMPQHKVVRTLVDNNKLRDKFKNFKHGQSQFFRVDIGDGVELDGWCIKPPGFDSKKRYPVLFQVYGEPAAQSVLDHWGGTVQMWHHFLAQQGYVVMSIDNRGTPAPRGREWRKVIYRQVGILAPQEQAAAVKALLARWSYLDPGRVGVWGWSGGGSMTLNAIFRYPDLYQTGMSVAPVSNQRYYDTIYQERYMGLPDDNVTGYRDGSPVTHAHKLKGSLLLVHGTGDDNVHYANTEAVIDELIANNKQFSMMAYPNRSHSIDEGPNTRRHLFTLLTSYLQKHLPPGPR
jgi:dipeptidyl-peptidase 4